MVVQDARQDDAFCVRGTRTQNPKPPWSVLAAASLPSARPEVAPPRRTRAQTVRCVEAARGVRDWVERLERACLRRQPLCSSNSNGQHRLAQGRKQLPVCRGALAGSPFVETARTPCTCRRHARTADVARGWGTTTRVTLSGDYRLRSRDRAEAGGRRAMAQACGTRDVALTARQTRPPGRPPRWSRSGCRPPPSS